MKRRIEHMAELGPCKIDIVPISDFTKPPLTREQLHSLWHLCGPTAERNMNRNPLWVVIVMAYYEGLAHAVCAGRGMEVVSDDLWKEIKEALLSAEWGFDEFGSFGSGEKNKKVTAVLDKLQLLGQITKEERE